MGRDSGTIIDSKRGRGMLWSRGEESIGESFSGSFGFIPYLPSGICLDGEILSWGRRLTLLFPIAVPYREKNPSPSVQKKESVRFQVYDLLKMNGKDMRKFPMHQRRSKLEELLQGFLSIYPSVYHPWSKKIPGVN